MAVWVMVMVPAVTMLVAVDQSGRTGLFNRHSTTRFPVVAAAHPLGLSARQVAHHTTCGAEWILLPATQVLEVAA